MARHFDLIILGNGAIGCALALEASHEHSLSIALVGPKGRPGSASAASGYMLNVFGELENGALDSIYAQKKFQLALKARDIWPEWVKRINEATGCGLGINLGTYVICNSAASDIDEENLDYIIKSLKKFGARHEKVNPSTIRGFQPAQSTRALRAVHIPDEGSIESTHLLQAYDQWLGHCNNVEVIPESVFELNLESSGRVKKVLLGNGQTIESKNLVIAAGAFSQRIIESIPSLAQRVPRIFYGTGTALHLSINSEIPGFSFELPNQVIRSVNRGNACGIHLVPYTKHSCYVGASNMITRYCEPNPRVAAAHGILRMALEELNTNFYKANFVIQVGHRPTSADTYMLVGKTSIEGLWIFTGTKREGVHLSPLLAQAFWHEFQGGKSVLPPEFLPERKLIFDMTKEQGIIKAVRHRISAAFQHGLQMPQNGWDRSLEKWLRCDIDALYDRLGIQVGIPPEILTMYEHGHIKMEGTEYPTVKAQSLLLDAV